ncbi:MAG: hypothetical protein ABIE84_01860 [bacterium]
MIIKLLIGLILPFLLGFTILSWIDRNKELDLPEQTGLSFLLGISATTLLLFWAFLLPLSHRSFLVGTFIVVFSFLQLLLVDKGRRIRDFVKKCYTVKWPVGQKNIVVLLLLIGLLFKLSYVFVEAGSKPEYSWDASNFWTTSAKAFHYFDRDYPAQALQGVLNLKSHDDYPRQMALSQAWLYDYLGEANDQMGKLLFPVTLVAFLFFFYAQVKKERAGPIALFFCYFLLSAPLFVYLATVGYADFTIAVYFSVGILCFYRWIREKKLPYFWLFSIFIALTLWIKIEGKLWLLLGLILLIVYLYRDYGRSIKEAALKVGQYLSAYLIISFPWQIVIWAYRLEARGEFTSNLGHFSEMQSFIYNSLFVQGSWGLFWFAATAALLVGWHKLINRQNIYLLLTIIMFYGALLFIYLFTGDGWDSMVVSFNRVLLSLYPVMVFTLAVVLPDLNELLWWRRKK